jgi:acyl carrier protein
MTETELKDLILKILKGIAPDVNPDEMEADENFRDQFDFDSLDFLKFVTELGQALGREIPARDYPKLSSLAGCLAYLNG